MVLKVRQQGFESTSGKKEFYVPLGFVDTQSQVTSVPSSGLTSILEIETLGDDRIYVSLTSASQALNAFQIQARANPDDSYQTLYSTSGDYTSPKGILVGVSADLTSLAAGTPAWLILEVRGLESVRLRATAATGTATLTVHARGS